MILGMRSLTWSASFFEDDEEDEEPGKFEKFLIDTFGEKVDNVVMSAVMVFSIFMAIAIFMVLPLLIAGIFRKFIHSETVMAILEGCIRIAIFITYIKVISRMDDIKRTFMYHGSEHKCINCLEHGLVLNVENVRKSSKEHKRCGTSFLLIVMVISILFFMVVRVDTIWLRIVSRIVLIPVIAGVSYEVLRLAGTSNSKIMDIVSRPGMWMQGLTTKEPDDSMIEVAIVAVEAVFDWKKYLEENTTKIALKQLEGKKRGTLRASSDMNLENRQLEEQIHELRDSLAAIAEEIKSLEQENTDRNAKIESDSAALEQAKADRDNASAALSEVQLEAANLKQQDSFLDQNIHRLEERRTVFSLKKCPCGTDTRIVKTRWRSASHRLKN